MKMMARLEYEGRLTTRALAAEWGVAEKTVQQHANEARRIQSAMARALNEHLAEEFVLGCRHRISACLAAGDEKNALGWAQLLAKVAGLEAALKFDTGGSLSDLIGEVLSGSSSTSGGG